MAVEFDRGVGGLNVWCHQVDGIAEPHGADFLGVAAEGLGL